MHIKVSIKNVYGSDLIYPVCDDAKEFANLAGTKSLTASAIRSIRRLGYAVEVIPTSSSKHSFNIYGELVSWQQEY